MDLIPNDWKHLLKTETSQKKFLKTISLKRPLESRRLKKIICFTLQSKSTNANKFLDSIHGQASLRDTIF